MAQAIVLWNRKQWYLINSSLQKKIIININFMWYIYLFSNICSSSFRRSSQPRDRPQVSYIAGNSLPSEPPGKPKNTGVGSLSLVQEIFLTQESNRGLLHCRRILYQLVKNMPPNTGDMVLIPKWGRSPGKGNAKPLQYSCLGNSTGRRNLAG